MPAVLRCALIGLGLWAAGQHAPLTAAQAADAVRVTYTVKEDWKAGRFGAVPGDPESIPLPEPRKPPPSVDYP